MSPSGFSIREFAHNILLVSPHMQIFRRIVEGIRSPEVS